MKFVRQIFRSHRALFVGLALILAALLVTKFVYPLYLRAQTTPASSSTATSTGSASCHIDDVFDYVAPNCGVGVACPTIQASYIPAIGTPHVGDLPNYVEYINANTFKQFSGSGNFIYAVTGDTVRLAQDNVWGTQMCSNGSKAMYRLISSDGTIGSPQRKQVMSCGDIVSSNHQLHPYVHNPAVDSSADPLNFALQACTVAGYDTVEHTDDQLIYGGKAKCNPGANPGITGSLDVAIFKNLNGPGAGEVYVYCKKYGLCALYDNLNNTPNNQPANWNENTDVCNLAGGEKPTTYYEFNVQRETSQKVLGNFYDEYSLACLPKESYSIGFENTDKCGQPGYSCPGDWKTWNVPGNLTFTADGKGFGLFRNEAATVARITSGGAPSRYESVESYMSTPNQNSPTSTPDPNRISNQGPIYSLNSFEQQCNFVVNKLKAVENLCKAENRVDLYTTAGLTTTANPNNNACALDTLIPGTTSPYKQSDMLAAFNAKGMDCTQLVKSAITNPADQQFLGDLLKVNVSLDTAYRPAFIVAVTEFDGPNSGNNVSTDSNPPAPAGTAGKFQVIDYLEVKIPAVATDFLPPSATANSDQMNPARNSYKDAMQLAAESITSKDFQDATIKQQTEDRAKLSAYGFNNTSGSIIGVNGMPFFCHINDKLVKDCNTHGNGLNSGTGPDYLDQIPTALVQFINANGAAKLDATNWDTLPCEANDVNFYDPANTKKIAETATSILSLLSAQKAGPYDKQTKISTNITVNVKDKTAGGDISTHTELYFVTPQRYAMQFEQKAFLSFLDLNQQADSNKGTLDPSSYSPLLKSALGKSLTGSKNKTGTQYNVGPVPATDPLNPNPTPAASTFQLTAKLNELGTQPDQSFFWRIAGQVASLPTRIMALLNTPHDSPINKYTQACTGDTATEDWFTGKCLPSAQQSQSPSPTSNPGDTGMCIETKIADSTKLNEYAIALKRSLAQLDVQNLWSRYFSGYLPGATQYLFTNGDSRCNATGNCFDLVIDSAVANNLNPYLAIAIALNETGGLKSAEPNGAGPHFGCGVNSDPSGPTIGNETIPKKLQCMIGAFNAYATQGKSANDALTTYGYVGGYHNHNLSTIIGLLSNNSYTGVCQ